MRTLQRAAGSAGQVCPGYRELQEAERGRESATRQRMRLAMPENVQRQ